MAAYTYIRQSNVLMTSSQAVDVITKVFFKISHTLIILLAHILS